jgi:hypothetical protein
MQLIFLTLTDLVDATGPNLPPGFEQGVRDQDDWAHWANLSIQLKVVMLESLASRPGTDSTRGWEAGTHAAIMRARHIARTLREEWRLIPYDDVPWDNCDVQPKVPLVVSADHHAGLAWAREILARSPDAVPTNRRQTTGLDGRLKVQAMNDAARAIADLTAESKRVLRALGNGARRTPDILKKAVLKRNNWTRARKPLHDHGLVEKEKRGFYQLTDSGWAALAMIR